MKISIITPSIRPKGLEITQKFLSEQTFTDFEWLVELSIPERGHDLNAAYNRAIKRAKGELIVSLQDWIKVTPMYLEKFWNAYKEYPKTFFTAPVGKTNDPEYKENARWDWRAYSDARPLWNCWEIDSGACPKDALYEVGGFDEELDGKWSADNVSVAWRAYLKGYKFMNLFNNPSIAFDHDAFTEHPFRKDFDPSLNNQRMREVEMGELNIDYLGKLH